MSDTFIQNSKILCGRSALPQLVNEMDDLSVDNPLVLCDSPQYVPVLKKHLTARIHVKISEADFESAVSSGKYNGFISMGDKSADLIKAALASGESLPWIQIYLPSEECRSITGYYETGGALNYSRKGVPHRIFFDSVFLKKLNQKSLESCMQTSLVMTETALFRAADDPFIRAYALAARRLLSDNPESMDIINASLLAQTAFSNLKLPEIRPGDDWISFLETVSSEMKEFVS